MKQIIYHFRTRGTGPEGVHIAGIAEGFEAAGYTVTFVSPTDRDPRVHRGSNPFQQKKETSLQKLSRKAPQLVFELGEMAYNRSAQKKMRAVTGEFEWIYERYAFFCHAAHSIGGALKRPYALEVNELSGDDRIRPQVLTRLCAKNERRVLQGAEAVFPVSRYLADRIIELGVPARRVHVVPNGVDAPAFFERPLASRAAVRQRYGLAEDDCIFVFVGWFVPWHHLEQLLAAFARSFVGRSECKLVLAGDGPLRQSLIESAKRLKIEAQLVLPGAIEYSAIPEFLSAADVGVVPAVNAYRSPIKLFEYMGAGLPIVAADVEAIRSILPEAQAPLLFDQKDFEDLARALALAGEIDGALGLSNRDLCQKSYTYQNHARTICSVMENAGKI